MEIRKLISAGGLAHGKSVRWVLLSILISVVTLAGGCVSTIDRTQRTTRDPADSAQAGKNKAVDTHIQLSVGYLERGQYEVALEKIETALQFNPNSGDAHTVAGAVNEAIGRYEQANYHYTRAAKLEPDDGGVLNNYGQFLCKSGKPAEAETYFRKAIEDPFYKTPSTALGNACTCFANSGDNERAEPFCRDAIERDSQVPDPYFHLAAIYYQQGQDMKARAFLQRYESVGVDTAESLLLCVQIETRLKADDLAISCRKRLIDDFPQSQQAQELIREATR
jgi:type IV pilus assembly protein PilF